MGVRRLTKYVHYTNNVWTKLQLKDTLVVLDGLSLVWFLYQKGIDCRCGGEYDEFAEAVRGFFHSLISEGVTPYVLIDGPNLWPSSRTENEITSSNKLAVDDCDAFVLPLLAKLVFVQELRSFGIRFVICDGEADQELAALANHWHCPVISNDSDFFIYDLPAGYIPLSSLDFTSRPTISARLFNRHRLARHLKIHEDFLPLFASLMGNDYVEEETLAPFKKALFPRTDGVGTKALIMTIANFISRFQSPSEALLSAVDLSRAAHNSSEEAAADEMDETNESHETDLRSEIDASMSEYDISDNSMRGYFEQNETRTSWETRHDKIIPAYVVRGYRDGRFPVAYMGALVSSEGAQVLKVQVEDSSEESAHMCSIYIRRISYGIVTEGPTALEFDRAEKELAYQDIEPLFGAIHLRNVRDVGTHQRLKLLLVVLKANTTLIKSLPESFQLFGASVRYWISRAEPGVKKTWVQALLLVHLKLIAERGDKAFGKSSRRRNQMCNRRLGVQFDIKCQHSYAQWQSVLMEATMLNQILICPLPEPDIATMYSGITAQTIAEELKQGANVDSFVESEAFYNQLYAAVTEGLVEWLVEQEQY